MTAAEGVEIAREGEWIVARWSGDIDMANATQFQDQTLEAVKNTDQGVTIDLSSVGYMDSAGMRALMSIRRLIENRQQRMSLIVPERSPLQLALEVGGVVALIPTFTTEDAARTAR